MRAILVGVFFINASPALADNLILDGQIIPLDDEAAFEIDLRYSDMRAVSAHGALECTAPGTDDPEVTLSAFPAHIDPGDDVQLSWTTAFAESCTPTLGTPQWTGSSVSLPNGSMLIQGLETSTTFGLSCTNAFGTTQDTAFVDVGGGGGGGGPFPGPGVFPSGCSTNPTPGTSWQHEPSTFEAIFDSGFPSPPGLWENIYVHPNQWVAAWFDTEGPTTAKFLTETTVGPGGNAPRMFAFSQCPGDFSPVEPDCVLDQGISGTLWIRIGGSPSPGVCDLEANSSYYLNGIHARASNPAQTTCVGTAGAPCVMHILMRGPWE